MVIILKLPWVELQHGSKPTGKKCGKLTSIQATRKQEAHV